MIGKNYKAHKENVLKIYNIYKERRGTIDDEVDIDILQSRIDALKNGKFTLAVAGEVKAGKSTFLNALLGEEILPTDVLQATSAIIEIFKAKSSCLKIKYGDGNTEEITESVKERLKEICNVKDEYREIPYTLINEIICIKDDLVFSDLNIKDLEKKSGYSNLNDKKHLIEKYIRENPKSKVPITISFGYPLKWEFEELRLVDSPGVNATGGVQEISLDFFSKANAIIFVHPIKPVESQSFQEFVKKTISEKSKVNLFLVLTHSGLYSKKQVEKLHAEAKRLYREDISEERIIVVDSVLSVIHNELLKGKALETICNEDEDKEIVLQRYEEISRKEGIELTEVLRDASGFEKMYKIIDDFSMRAPELQLKEILEKINKGYTTQTVKQEDKIKYLELKKKTPQHFAEEIVKKKQRLEEYKTTLTDGADDIIEKLSVASGSEYLEQLNSLVTKLSAKILKAKHSNEVRKIAIDTRDVLKDFMNEYTKTITIEFNSLLEDASSHFEQMHSDYVPKFDLEAIEEKSKQEAYKMKDIYKDRPKDFWDSFLWGLFDGNRGNLIKTGKQEKVYDDSKFLQNLQENLIKNLEANIEEIQIKSENIFENYLISFKTKVKEVIESRKYELQEIEDKKQSTFEIIDEIKRLKRNNCMIQEELKRIGEILDDILL